MVIQSYLDHKLLREAFRMKDVMESDGLQPHLMTYTVFLDGLIRSGEALGLYHLLTEIFTRADDLIAAQHDFAKLQHTFPQSTQVLQRVQNDPKFTKRQQFITFLRPYIWATCHLLTARGHKRHSDNLATFWYTNGGSQVNSALDQAPTHHHNNNSTTTTTKGDAFGSFASMNRSQAQQDDTEYCGTKDVDGVRQVLNQLQSQHDLVDSTQPPHDEDALLDNADITMGALDTSMRKRKYPNGSSAAGAGSEAPGHGAAPNLKAERLRQLQLRDDDLYGSIDSIFDEIGLSSNLSSEAGGHMGSSQQGSSDQNHPHFSTAASHDLINHALNNTLVFDPFPHLASSALGGQVADRDGGDKQGKRGGAGAAGGRTESTMFDVHHLHRLPANSLNDYIDRTSLSSSHPQQAVPSSFQRTGETNQQHYQSNQSPPKAERGKARASASKHAPVDSTNYDANMVTNQGGRFQKGGKGKGKGTNYSAARNFSVLLVSRASRGGSSPSIAAATTSPTNTAQMLEQIAHYSGEVMM
jgi:hypothetical protein